MRILACDSGVERTGYAIFDTSQRDNKLIMSGCIFTSKAKQLSERLYELGVQLEEFIIKHKPETIVIERLYFNTNQITIMSVAQAQGVLLALAGKYDIATAFLTPTQIKHVVTGYGRSDKKAVQKMLRLLLGLEKDPKPDDVADAIACGLAYCTINRLI